MPIRTSTRREEMLLVLNNLMTHLGAITVALQSVHTALAATQEKLKDPTLAAAIVTLQTQVTALATNLTATQTTITNLK
jgi:hypothetical protein